MHPILGRLRQLGLYLVAWIPLAGTLVYLLGHSGDLRWTEATVLMFPLCILYAFICLAAWYPCRATPIEKSGFIKLLLTHLTAGVVLSAVWIQIGKALAGGMERWPSFLGLENRIARHFPLLFVTGVLLYVLSVTFYYVLLAEQASREAQERALEARVLARDAELKALRAQVNPHFLFNCLNSISALTSVDSGKARDMCILLADFLRTTLRVGGKETIALEEELALIRGYLAIEKVRFGARVQMEESVENEALGVPLPPLLLQPLVENAIRHGIANLPEGGIIGLSVRRAENSVAIVVENSFDPDSPASLKTGLGLDNVRRRLHARYGNEASISAGAEGERFLVKLRLPAQLNGDKA
jgi:two-component system, LytTR family, sensor histidine kinase AlgZ